MTRDRRSSNSVFSLAQDVTQNIVFQSLCFRTASKSEVKRLEKLHGWSQSKTVATLVEQALAHRLGEQFAVMIRHTIQEAVKTELQKDREWLRKINLSEYLAAEQARLHAIDIHRLLIPPDQDINQKIKDNRANAYKHLKFYFHSISVQDTQSPWPSSK
jgi:hypothetical protein